MAGDVAWIDDFALRPAAVATTSKVASAKSAVGTVSLPAASTLGWPPCGCPSAKWRLAIVHWIGVPVAQPFASSTTARMLKSSPSRRSLRAGRTSRRAASPGVVHGLYGFAPVAPPFLKEGGGTLPVTVGAAAALATGPAAAAVMRLSDPPRLTSAMQRAPLIVNS